MDSETNKPTAGENEFKLSKAIDRWRHSSHNEGDSDELFEAIAEIRDAAEDCLPEKEHESDFPVLEMKGGPGPYESEVSISGIDLHIQSINLKCDAENGELNECEVKFAPHVDLQTEVILECENDDIKFLEQLRDVINRRIDDLEADV